VEKIPIHIKKRNTPLSAWKATSSLLIWKVTGSPKWLPLPPKLIFLLKLMILLDVVSIFSPTEFLKIQHFWPSA